MEEYGASGKEWTENNHKLNKEDASEPQKRLQRSFVDRRGWGSVREVKRSGQDKVERMVLERGKK